MADYARLPDAAQAPAAVLLADLDSQWLCHVTPQGVTHRWPFSWSRRPLSCAAESFGTPWGWHEIAEKHGDDAPVGTVFEARVSTQQHYRERPDAGPDQPNLVTTRILRLKGLEGGLNAGPGCDSHARMIYIHGTNHPERFPERVSRGCLLLRDADLLELYGLAPSGTPCWLRCAHT